jgi:hypothetical protein
MKWQRQSLPGRPGPAAADPAGPARRRQTRPGRAAADPRRAATFQPLHWRPSAHQVVHFMIPQDVV